jgi:hypothetical protein
LLTRLHETSLTACFMRDYPRPAPPDRFCELFISASEGCQHRSASVPQALLKLSVRRYRCGLVRVLRILPKTDEKRLLIVTG